MTRIPLAPPFISPVSPTEHRPLWSVMVPVFNCISYLPDTLKSILIHHYPEEKMQIEVVDDASTDGNVAALVYEIGKGRIKYFRQPENVGSLRNFETCIKRSKGHLIHLLHGDDKVRKGYYETVENLFNNFPEAGAAFCNYININENGIKISNQPPEQRQPGILKNWLLKIAEFQRIQYVAITVRREVYEQLGSFYALNYAEDWEMWVRIARDYDFAYTPEILAEYRRHEESISANKYFNAEYLDDLEKAMELIQNHLDDRKKKNLLKKSKKFYAHYALRIANRLWDSSHNITGVRNNIERGLEIHKDLHLFFKIFKLYLKVLLRN